MKIHCTRSSLSDSWAVAQAVIPTRPTRPILANVKVCATGEGIELHATDMDIGIRLRLENAEVLEEGVAVIPAALFGSILRDSWAEKVEISTEEALVHVTMENSRFKIHGDDPEHFPQMPDFDKKNTFEIPKNSFLEMVHLTTFATAREDTRYALQGVLMEVKAKNVAMVATDGRRLSYVKSKIPEAVAEDVSAIIPPRGLQEIERALADDDEVVEIAVDQNRLIASGKRAVIFTQLIEGTFPDYREVIPSGNDKKATVNREELLACLRQAAKMTSEDSRAVNMSFGDGKLTLSASSPEAGDVVIEASVQYTEEPFEIRFNPAFLTDVLRAVSAEEISMEFREKTTPGILRAGKDFLYVIMPINVE